MTTGSASNVSATGATLSASFTGVNTTTAPQTKWIEYGTTSGNLSEIAYYNGVIDTASGSFTVDIASLSSSTTYYYKAYMTVWNGSTYVEIEGEERSFTTPAPSPVTDLGYLTCYEVPDVTVLTHSTGSEHFGSTSYHAYTTSNSNQKVVTHTFSYNSNTLRNYTLLYDRTKHAALWVAFVMNHDSYPWNVSRSDSWYADPGIDATWQPNLSSGYKESSTYARGHQAASNDRRTTTEQTQQTTYFSNMTPQISGFNGGVWASLEGDIQKIGNACTGSTMLFVVTGPIFGSGYGTTQDKNGMECAVPTQYFKCIMKVTYSGNTPSAAVGAAYLLDHQSGATRQNVSIDDIEKLTGFNFFAHVPTDLQNAAEAEVHPTSYFPQTSISTSE